jgi:hypothetical protein
MGRNGKGLAMIAPLSGCTVWHTPTGKDLTSGASGASGAAFCPDSFSLAVQAMASPFCHVSDHLGSFTRPLPPFKGFSGVIEQTTEASGYWINCISGDMFS